MSLKMKITGAQILLEMLKLYDVKHVFGLPGETTLALYKYWAKFPEVKHILTHDERSAAYMAEAYAKVTGRVGVSEAPSPGASHPAPGVLESFTGSVPTVLLTSDVPYNCDKKNMLSGFDQNKLYSSITKESLLVTRAKDIPYIIRRAFRVALSDRPGAVHVKIPMDVYMEETEVCDLYADPRGITWPAYRPVADFDQIVKASELLATAKSPVIVCGQGALVSGAGEAVLRVAEALQIPVGCTMTAKGTISETHPLSIRLIGARGGTSYSNQFLKEADLVFFVGSNTDSAGTDAWQLPCCKNVPKVIQLDISGIEAGNNYPLEVCLVGDAKATMECIADYIDNNNVNGCAENAKKIEPAMKSLDDSLVDYIKSNQHPIHPVRLVKTVEKFLPNNSYVVVEAGVGSIFSAAYITQKIPGRKFVSNYSQGALGYTIPACAAIAVAHPDALVVGMAGDGSFHFSCGELETYCRLGLNVKLFLFNNNVFGWIKGETAHVYQADFFATDFGVVDYAGVAKAFGIKSYKLNDPDKIEETITEAFEYKGPVLIEVRVPDESELVPPVPRWINNAKKKGLPYCY